MDHPCYKLDQYFTGDKPCLSFNIEDIRHTKPYDDSQIHRHNYYEIYLFETSADEHIIEFDKFKPKAKSISVIFPRQFHKLNINDNTKGKVIMFNEELFCSEILHSELRAYCIDLQNRLNNIQVTQEQYDVILSYFDIIAQLFKNLNILKKEQIRHLIKLILLNLMDFSKSKILSKHESVESNLFLEFTELVNSEYKDMRLVSEYSDKLGISTKKINSLSKQYNGQTALHLIHDRIYLEAKRMLAFSGTSYKEIAYELKFDSPSAFNKFIHNKSGLTPSDLQHQLTQIHKKDA